MSHKSVSHLWAAQSRNAGTSGPLYFERETIFSYGPHYPIAMFTPAHDARGRQIVLFNVQGSTKTTESKHKPAVRDALNGLPVRVIYVAHVYLDSHALNVAEMRERFDAKILAASRARVHGSMLLEEAESIRADAIAYSLAFGLDVIEWPEVSPELLTEAREKAGRASADRARADAQRRADAMRDYGAKLEAWRAGFRDSLPYFQDAPTALRLIDGGAIIETSRGARVPVTVAPRLWELSQKTRKASRAFAPQKPLRVGDFVLVEVRADGSMVIGCHVLEYSEIESFCVGELRMERAA